MMQELRQTRRKQREKRDSALQKAGGAVRYYTTGLRLYGPQ